MPGSASIWRASSRATARVTFFSCTPDGPCAPGSLPPCPASIAMISSRWPAPITSCSVFAGGVLLPRTAVAFSSCRATTGAGTGAGASMRVWVGTARRGGDKGVDGRVVGADTASMGTGLPGAGRFLPWISTISRSLPPSRSIRLLELAGAPRSNTMRRVSASGLPVRRFATRPFAAGALNCGDRRVPGRSSTSRSGLARVKSL